MKKIQQSLTYGLLITLTMAVWALLILTQTISGLEGETLRWRYQARGELASSAPIVHVDLDVETVSYMGDRPWDRREFGVLCHALLGPGQARLVGIDIILSKFGAGALLDFERAREGNAFLGRIVEAFPEQIVLAAAYTGIKSAMPDDSYESSVLPLIRNGHDDPEAAPFPEAPSFPIIKETAGRLGLADVDEALTAGSIPYFLPAFVQTAGPRFALHIINGARRHYEGILNQPEVVVQDDRLTLVDASGWDPVSAPLNHEQTLFSLGIEMFLAAHNLNADAVSIDSNVLTIHRGGTVFRRVPLVAKQSVEVNWFEGWKFAATRNRISMQTVLRKADALAEAARMEDACGVAELEAWFERFEDKVVFVGPVDPQLKDIAPTPFNREPVPKVGLHANLYRTIESEAYVRRSDLSETLLILFVLTISVSVLAFRSGWARLLAPLALLVYGGAASFVFAKFHYVLPLLAPMGSATMASVLCIALKLGSEEWQRRRIKTLFGAYVSPKLVEEMVDSNQTPQLGGVESEITALFSDVVGFSALSEELSPGELVGLMNEYLSAMTEVFQGESGTLDKYVGDAIVTMFGMPVWIEDHAARACIAAVRMQEQHAQLRQQWANSGKWPRSVIEMRTRIGINTGNAVIGNMGSEMRFNYTMMGDSVNLAARCESGAKTYGVYTMVTESTLHAALATRSDLNYRKLDRIVVKGRRKPVIVYELWDGTISLEKIKACKPIYEAALDRYFQGEWVAALAGFEASAELEPARDFAPTTPSHLLAARCLEFIEKGGPEEWDGAYRLKAK
ncbi:MAG: CHASE2 domain-containing protein [Verrucomicrobia bacterium]|jgi:adenylate cyclase|nr:CHASE2 domain-containing protein [Verrucomicrobiota bacterium]